jgi:hypothetical protein
MLESATQKIKISGNILTTKTFEDDLHHDRRNRFLGPCLVSRKKMKRKKKTDTGGVGRLQASK